MVKAFLGKHKKRIVFVVLAFVLVYLVSYILDPYSIYWQTYRQRDWLSLSGEFITVFVQAAIISEISILLNNKLNSYLPWKEHPGKRIVLETTLNLLSVLAINLVCSLIYDYTVNNEPLSAVLNTTTEEDTKGLIQFLVANFIVSITIMAINTGIYLIENWKNEAVRASELNQLAIESELQALKLQIDPHFVFNNLSVLSELILENQQLGYDYAENFTKIYRYMLVNAKKDLISLEDELKFLQSYIFLMKQRIGDGVRFEVNVDPHSKVLYMPPMTIQILVENALKHNKVSKTNPLQIRIYNNSEHELAVENTLQLIEKTLESSGLGLKNVIRRYNLISNKTPAIVKDSATFKVIIPLLKYDQYNIDN